MAQGVHRLGQAKRAEGSSGGIVLKRAQAARSVGLGIQDSISGLEGPGPVTSRGRVRRRLLAVTAGPAGSRRKVLGVAAWKLHAGTARDTNKKQEKRRLEAPPTNGRVPAPGGRACVPKPHARSSGARPLLALPLHQLDWSSRFPQRVAASTRFADDSLLSGMGLA